LAAHSQEELTEELDVLHPQHQSPRNLQTRVMGCSRVVVWAKVLTTCRAPDAHSGRATSAAYARIARHIPHELDEAREQKGRLIAFMRGSNDANTLQPESALQRAMSRAG